MFIELMKKAKYENIYSFYEYIDIQSIFHLDNESKTMHRILRSREKV